MSSNKIFKVGDYCKTNSLCPIDKGFGIITSTTKSDKTYRVFFQDIQRVHLLNSRYIDHVSSKEVGQFQFKINMPQKKIKVNKKIKKSKGKQEIIEHNDQNNQAGCSSDCPSNYPSDYPPDCPSDNPSDSPSDCPSDQINQMEQRTQ